MGGSPDIPRDVDEQIEIALTVLQTRGDGHLPLPLRREVRSHFGEMGEGDPGRRRLFDLFRQSTERVLGVWTSERPEDDRPTRMIELGEGILTGGIEEAATKSEYDRFVVDLDNLADEIGGRAYAAGRAAADLVSTAAVGDYADDTPRDADDEDLDPDVMSSDYFASLAEASFFGAPDEDPDARRAFWRWYLEEAVPAAYSAVDYG